MGVGVCPRRKRTAGNKQYVSVPGVGGAATTAAARSGAGVEKAPFPHADLSAALTETTPLTGSPGVRKTHWGMSHGD